MASTARIRETIADLVGRPYSVRIHEIRWIMDQLGAVERPFKRGRLFRIGRLRIVINEHNNGKDTVPKYSVDELRDLMIELDLY